MLDYTYTEGERDPKMYTSEAVAQEIHRETINTLAYFAQLEAIDNWGPRKPKHDFEVKKVTNNHGYPYKAICTCGWESWGYMVDWAAQTMGEDHIANA